MVFAMLGFSQPIAAKSNRSFNLPALTLIRLRWGNRANRLPGKGLDDIPGRIGRDFSLPDGPRFPFTCGTQREDVYSIPIHID